MRKYLTEFIGTMFLVLTIGLTVIQSAAPGVGIIHPLAIGSVLMVMVYMGGHISGGHYNPAVSLAAFVRGKLDGRELVPYWISQVAGAAAAAGLTKYILLGKGVPGVPIAHVGPALVVEILFTFALALVVLNTATAKGTAGNSFYGLAIGFTVLVGAFAGGAISRGAFNPAVGVGGVLVGAPIGDLWIHLVGPLTGGALAGLIFKVQNPEG